MTNAIGKFTGEQSLRYCPQILLLLRQIAGTSPEISFRYDDRIYAIVIAVSTWHGSKCCMAERFIDPDLIATARCNVMAMEMDDLIAHVNDRVRSLETEL